MLTLASDGFGTSVDQIHGVNGGGAAGRARMEEDGAPLFFQVSEQHQDEELKHGHHDAPPQQQGTARRMAILAEAARVKAEKEKIRIMQMCSARSSRLN